MQFLVRGQHRGGRGAGDDSDLAPGFSFMLSVALAIIH